MLDTCKILSADVVASPFPHLVTTISDEGRLAPLLEHWPSSENMHDEGIQRRLKALIEDNEDRTDAVHPFWADAVAGHLLPMIEAIGEKFRPFIEAKVMGPMPALNVHRLYLLEADEDFVEHTPHTHYNTAPNWLFTFLLYIDDNGRTDRGTTLYDTSATADTMLAGAGGGVCSPVVDTGFAPGRLLAFLDGPRAYHGSTPFVGNGAPAGRKIIRGHVSLLPGDTQRLYGTADVHTLFARASNLYRDTGNASALEMFSPGIQNDQTTSA